MGLRCILGHRWEPTSVYNYYDVSWGYEVPSFNLTSICKYCGKVKVQDFYGGGHKEIR